MHQEIIEQALAELDRIDPTEKQRKRLMNKLTKAMEGNHTLVAIYCAMVAMCACIEMEKHEDTQEFLYHMTMGLLSVRMMEAGVFDELIEEMEKVQTDDSTVH